MITLRSLHQWCLLSLQWKRTAFSWMVLPKTPFARLWPRFPIRLAFWLVMILRLVRLNSKLLLLIFWFQLESNQSHVCPTTIWETMMERISHQRGNSSPKKHPNPNASKIFWIIVICMLINLNILIILWSLSMSLKLGIVRKLLMNTPVKYLWEAPILLSATMSVRIPFSLLASL